jgi:protein-tyrosine phosphatase
MRPRLYTVPCAGAGRLSIMACPRGGDWLAEELHGLRRLGVDVLVCALTHAEQVELGLTEEASVCTTAGLAFIAIPIPDRAVPDAQTLEPVLIQLHAAVAAGRHVVIHCRAGIGRASLVAGALLVAEGLDPEQAWQRLAAARGLAVPDTDQQRQWLQRFARQYRQAAPPNRGFGSTL